MRRLFERIVAKRWFLACPVHDRAKSIRSLRINACYRIKVIEFVDHSTGGMTMGVGFRGRAAWPLAFVLFIIGALNIAGCRRPAGSACFGPIRSIRTIPAATTRRSCAPIGFLLRLDFVGAAAGATVGGITGYLAGGSTKDTLLGAGAGRCRRRCRRLFRRQAEGRQWQPDRAHHFRLRRCEKGEQRDRRRDAGFSQAARLPHPHRAAGQERPRPEPDQPRRRAGEAQRD